MNLGLHFGLDLSDSVVTERLPEAVVREGRLLIVGEENSVERVDLSLPDGVSCSPQSCQDINHGHLVPGRTPGEHHDDDKDVDDGPQDKDGNPSDLLDDKTEPDRGGGIADSEHDQDSADNVDTVCTSHEALRESGELFRS